MPSKYAEVLTKSKSKISWRVLTRYRRSFRPLFAELCVMLTLSFCITHNAWRMTHDAWNPTTPFFILMHYLGKTLSFKRDITICSVCGIYVCALTITSCPFFRLLYSVTHKVNILTHSYKLICAMYPMKNHENFVINHAFWCCFVCKTPCKRLPR